MVVRTVHAAMSMNQWMYSCLTSYPLGSAKAQALPSSGLEIFTNRFILSFVYIGAIAELGLSKGDD